MLGPSFFDVLFLDIFGPAIFWKSAFIISGCSGVLFSNILGKTCVFIRGFPFKFWAPLLWCFVFQHLALVVLETFDRLWCRLGLPLGLVGPPRAKDDFSWFFGSPLVRPTWPFECRLNTEKQAVFGAFMRKGWSPEIATSEPHSFQNACFLAFFVNFRGQLLN